VDEKKISQEQTEGHHLRNGANETQKKEIDINMPQNHFKHRYISVKHKIERLFTGVLK
jgi:hypothetical protein